MMVDFDSVFNPTPQQKRRQYSNVKSIIEEGIRSNSCSLCAHGIIEEIPKWGPELEGCKIKMLESRGQDHCDRFEISENCLIFLSEAEKILGQEQT